MTMNELFLQNIPSIDVCISVEKFSHVLLIIKTKQYIKQLLFIAMLFVSAGGHGLQTVFSCKKVYVYKGVPVHYKIQRIFYNMLHNAGMRII